MAVWGGCIEQQPLPHVPRHCEHCLGADASWQRALGVRAGEPVVTDRSPVHGHAHMERVHAKTTHAACAHRTRREVARAPSESKEESAQAR
eukprot:5849679-Prymnesium_polylepis.1